MPVTSIYNFPFQGLSDPPHGPNLGEDLAEAVEATLQPIDARARLGPNSKAISNNIIAGTTTAAAYADMPATSSLSFVKLSTTTAIAVHLDVGCFSTATNTIARFGVRINGVDHDITEITCNTANLNLRGSGTRDVASGLTADTYTIQARWFRTSGSGTLTISNAWFSMRATEVLSA